MYFFSGSQLKHPSKLLYTPASSRALAQNKGLENMVPYSGRNKLTQITTLYAKEWMSI